ncbi:uncharacterized protein [Miscanthus floridulus]|uniref:uncharacterized protein isoform X2 n=1 Tax=Miscanthus floridulus TaxID=154761 RepID=UPI00345962E8
MASSAAATAKLIALPPAPTRGGCCCWRACPRPTVPAAAARLGVSASTASSDVPDFLSSNWLETRKRKPFGPRLNVMPCLKIIAKEHKYLNLNIKGRTQCRELPLSGKPYSRLCNARRPRLEPRTLRSQTFSAEEAVEYQLESLKYNYQPHQDYGIEVMYRFAGFDPFERSTYFGRQFDLGQFERFRRLFHHSSYRVLLGHKERNILSSLWVEESLGTRSPSREKGRTQCRELFLMLPGCGYNRSMT